MPLVKLTKRVIDSAPQPQEGQIFLRDSELPGFGVRLTHGSTSFILERRIHGQVRRLTIGPYGPLALEEARKRAEELIGQIAKGQDPAQDILDRKHEPTFGDLVERYKKEHIPRKKSGMNDENMLSAYLKGWNNRKLSSISRKDIVALHAQVGQNNGPYAANRLVALLRKMFNLAHLWGLWEEENPATGIEFFREEKRDRFIQPKELPGLMQSLKQEPNVFIRSAFFVCLLTGQRKSEVLSMKWEDLDMEAGIWKIPETKPGRPHFVPLPGAVLDLLNNLPHVSENPYVFAGQRNNHLVNITKGWNRIRTRAGLRDVRIHDIRRTLGSWLAGSGASLPLIGKVLNHSQPSTTAIYARLALEPVRLALEANAEKMLSVSGEISGERTLAKHLDDAN